MALTKITKTGLGAGAVDSTKIEADSIDATKIADNAISDEHLDVTAISGQTELAEAAAGTDVLLIFDTSTGTLKKIQASNVGLQAPTLSSVSPTDVLSGDGTGNYTFTLTGTGFSATAVPTLITDGGSTVSFDSFTINSNTQITAVIAKSSLTNANEPYDVKVTAANGLSSTLENQINIDAQPVFNTASGSLGSFSEQTTISTIDIEATDPESAGNVTFEIITGSLPAGLSTATVNEDGVSKFRITGTLSTDVASLTTSNFTVRAADAASNTSTREFSITEIPSAIESFTSSGTFSVPTGITAVDVLVVAGGGGGAQRHGGGGGAGGLIFVPQFSVTPGGTVTVTVGDGDDALPGQSGPSGNGQDSVFGTLTAKGGGPGNECSAGFSGGSGGGGGGPGTGPGPGGGGAATQPTQPGQSGAYGFGNPGTSGTGTPGGLGGGGGGAGGVGTNAGVSPLPATRAGQGGVGLSYTIADGTTPVYYAGGGGGGTPGGQGQTGNGGTGGGGPGGLAANDGQPGSGRPGSANTGGGGGGAANGVETPSISGGAGGKGIVIVSY